MTDPSPIPRPPERQQQAPSPLPGGPSCDADRVLASDDLLQGARTVAIRHNGSLYRLQATRLGKLILTK